MTTEYFPRPPRGALPSEDISERLRKAREHARSEAEGELRALGFEGGENDVWAGTLTANQENWPAEVVLPPDFPDSLPEIRIDHGAIPRRLAHLEKSGKVCVVPPTGVVLDTKRPRALIREALERAEVTVADGLSGKNEADVQREFLAYWGTNASGKLFSLCRTEGGPRTVYLFSVGGSNERLVADEQEDAEHWAANAGRQVSREGEGFYIPLQEGFSPPDFDEAFRGGDVRKVVAAGASADSSKKFEAWLSRTTLPAVVILSLPASDRADRFLVALRLQKTRGSRRKEATAGFRPGKAPALLETGRAPLTPAVQLDTVRMDAAALVNRGGGAKPLLESSIAVVGCGAVGSRLAGLLCEAGVGDLRLIDKERLEFANVHRHALGVDSVGEYKAEALSELLLRRFPHLRVRYRSADIESVLKSDPGFVTGADLITFALGDETLELRLNQVLTEQTRVHTWVEPLGVGGHALGTGLDRGGCFECLFRVVDGVGLTNQAAFAAPGQDFIRTQAGCGGGFSPFSALDATRSATVAAQLITEVLLGKASSTTLMSWRGEPTEFLKEGLLSRRAEVVSVGATARMIVEKRPDCPVCRNSG